MNTKQIQTTLKDFQRRLESLENQKQAVLPNRQAEQVDRRLEEMQRESSDRKLQILIRTAGALAHLKLDPVAWQRKVRKQWGARLKRQLLSLEPYDL